MNYIIHILIFTATAKVYKYLLIVLIIPVVIACSQTDGNTHASNKTAPNSKDSLTISLPEKTRPLLSELDGFYEVIDRIYIDNKVLKYSLFLPKTFDTVFTQANNGCTFSTERIIFSNPLYEIKPPNNTFSKLEVKDSLYYVSIEKDTTSRDFKINEEYKYKMDELRSNNPQNSKDRTASSYLYTQNDIARYYYEFKVPKIQSAIKLVLIYKDVLFKVNVIYLNGKLAIQKLDEMRTIIESFEVEEIKMTVNNQ